MKKLLLKKSGFILIALLGILSLSSCEKEVDYGPTYFDIKVNGVSYSLDSHYASYDGSMYAAAGDYDDDPYRISIFLYEASGTGEFMASDFNESASCITLWDASGSESVMYWDARTLDQTSITITKYDRGNVIEGNFEGYVYNPQNENDQLYVEGSFLVK